MPQAVNEGQTAELRCRLNYSSTAQSSILNPDHVTKLEAYIAGEKLQHDSEERTEEGPGELSVLYVVSVHAEI